jgi:ferredoxin
MQIAVQENKCSGCKLCQQICAIHHFKEQNPKKAAVKIKAEFPAPGRFTPKLCNQCGECADVCPAEAISLKNGAYVIDPDLCTLCEECVDACSKNAMTLPRGAETPVKCDLCMKCTEICNTGALLAIPEARQAQVQEELHLCTG